MCDSENFKKKFVEFELGCKQFHYIYNIFLGCMSRRDNECVCIDTYILVTRESVKLESFGVSRLSRNKTKSVGTAETYKNFILLPYSRGSPLTKN